ncbi:MAG TPA: Gfo/Idh/MocA family oxidoreductase [Cyclobacteriaceae bacterium]|nr:Gfo/Idh/MocA family oxidoreductase [Cyclobacteriaceae bacterium]
MRQTFNLASDKEIRWGVIGVGNVCEVKSAPAMNLVPNSKLVAVMRRDAQKAKAYAEKHQVAKWYDDADQLINDSEVNAIYIATPPHVHAAYTKKAAEAGKPVYVEKPMARTYQECLEMIAACEKAAVPLYVAYYRRTLPNFLKIKALVESGAIGEVRLVNIQMNQTKDTNIIMSNKTNWRVDPTIAGGGYFYDLASHQLDFLDFVFGPIKSAKGISSNQAGVYEAEDIVTAAFEFENGVMGVGSWCFTTAKSANKDLTTIVGSRGQISYSTFGQPHVLLETDEKGLQRFEFELPKHIQYFLIESIVNELLGKGQCPSTGITAARTNWAIQQIVYGSELRL